MIERTWDRRSFLRAVGGSVGLAVVGGGVRELGAAEGLPAASRGDGLPPRTVGLRTLGGDFRFDPAGLLVEPGSRVVWLNMGDFHTTTAFHPDNDDLLPDGVPLRIPGAARPWHSGMLGLDAGTDFEHRFRVPGVHDYFCQPHYAFGMVGRIVVGGPEGGPGTRPLDGLPEAVRATMPSLETIVGPVGRTFEWASRINGVLLRAARGEPAGAAAGAVRDAVADDGELGELGRAAGRDGELESAVARFVGGVGSGIGYEDLVQRADAAKDVLRGIREDA